MRTNVAAGFARIRLLVIGLIAVVSASGAVNQALIDKVAAGKVKTANAAWWGFNEADSTAALQAAINSGARRLIVPNVGKPWIVRPLFLASHQEIVFEKGVEVVAKRGYPEFQGGNDSLFTATLRENITLKGYGATLRMHRDDYAKAPYPKAEWRNTLDFKGCSNIKVYGLTLAESGGDGILLIRHGREGKDGTQEVVQCRDFHIKDVVCDGNYRQGISITSAENLLVEDCVMKNTGGTAPSAGIDVEPDVPEEKLTNLVFRNVVAENNEGPGLLVFLGAQNSTSAPVSVRFEKCRVRGTGAHNLQVGLGVRRISEGLRGKVEFVDCTVANTKAAGLFIESAPGTSLRVRLERCRFRNIATGWSMYPASDNSRNWWHVGGYPINITSASPAGGVALVDCVIEDSVDRPFLVVTPTSDVRSEPSAVSDITGRVTVINPHGARSAVGKNSTGFKLKVIEKIPRVPPALGEVNQALIDKVVAGKVKTANAAWWGFNEVDSTEALQAAINSGARRLVIPNLGKPWSVRPIFLASNQEIVFEKGVEVVAKRGYPEFKGGNDSLFTATLRENITLTGYGATLRMHRDDYAKAPYLKAEWRNVLDFKGCSNIKVYGLTLAESGGDGILLIRHYREGKDGTQELVQCRNFHIKDVVCDRNYRQGISITSAENLLIANTIMRNTGGTEPSAGIDIEPDDAAEKLVNVILRDCLTENNTGYGYMTFLSRFTTQSAPASIRFENCRSSNDVRGGFYTENPASGTIDFVDCTAEDSAGPGLDLRAFPANCGKVRFEGCSIINPALERPALSPIRLSGSGSATGSVEFVNLLIRDPLNRQALMTKLFRFGVYDSEGAGEHVSLAGLSGTIRFDLSATDAAKKRVLATLPEFWLFRFDPDKVGENEQWFAPATPKASPDWKFISTHNFWDSGREHVDGWYAIDQFIPKAQGKPVWLSFDSVDENYTLWINGQHLGDNLADGALMWDRAVAVDITGKYQEGAVNHIVVRVKNTGGAGGIWSPVTLMVER